MKSLFLTNKNALHSDHIDGGVQICSQEFYKVIESAGFELKPYFVPFTRNLVQRLKIKAGFEFYDMYDVKKNQADLLDIVTNNDIKFVFINMASAVRYAQPIKEFLGKNVKVVLLSHGNHSGDFLHLIERPLQNKNALIKERDIYRLGKLISIESGFRKKYLDAVLTISQTEVQIENWLGSQNTIFLPRLITPDFIELSPQIGRVGFVGRLDHPPNYQGVELLCIELEKKNIGNLKLRLVGAPPDWGNKLKKRFNFIEYLGELSESDLIEEIKSWSLFLNPVFWYSTGASTKLIKAIGWGLPIITTVAGVRGYSVTKDDLLFAYNPSDMADKILSESSSLNRVVHWINKTRALALNSPKIDEIARQLKDGLGIYY